MTIADDMRRALEMKRELDPWPADAPFGERPLWRLGAGASQALAACRDEDTTLDSMGRPELFGGCVILAALDFEGWELYDQ